MRVVTFTNLYPSVDQPRRGIFVEERLRHLVANGDLQAKVCALRPHATFNPVRLFGSHRARATESRNDIDVEYVPVPTVPKLSNWLDPLIWANASQRAVESLLQKDRDEVLLDAHFLYPDGVAAAILGRRLGVPVVMSARGSDVNVKCQNPIMARWVRWAALHSAAVITVSQALADHMRVRRISAKEVVTIPNGVDLIKFRRQNSNHTLAGTINDNVVLLSAGHLLKAKGHHIAIDVLAELDEAHLVIVGEGPYESVLRSQAARLGVAGRVHFLGHVAHSAMAEIYSMATLTILASDNEGMPNVLLESIACGTRAVATDVGGVSEVLKSRATGIAVSTRSAGAFLRAVRELLSDDCACDETRQFAEENFAWEKTVDDQLSLYRRVLSA